MVCRRIRFLRMKNRKEQVCLIGLAVAVVEMVNVW
jgi:hypothetical protein